MESCQSRSLTTDNFYSAESKSISVPVRIVSVIDKRLRFKSLT